MCDRCGSLIDTPGGKHCDECLIVCKTGMCTSCDKWFNFFPEHDEYNQLTARFLFCCNHCQKTASHKCTGCSKRTKDASLLLCSGCGVHGQTCFKCADLSILPKEEWFCSPDCETKFLNFMSSSSSSDPAPIRKRANPAEEKAALFDYIVEQNALMSQAIEHHNNYLKLDELKASNQRRNEIRSSLKRMDADCALSPDPMPVEEYVKRAKLAEEFHSLPDETEALTALRVSLPVPRVDFKEKSLFHLNKISETLSRFSK